VSGWLHLSAAPSGFVFVVLGNRGTYKVVGSNEASVGSNEGVGSSEKWEAAREGNLRRGWEVARE
jgi:hypothetical protein